MRKRLIVLAILILTLSACSMGSEDKSGSEPANAFQPEQPQANRAYEDSSVDLLTENQLPVERVILKNATLGMVVENPSERAGEISTEAESLGGWVVSLNTTQFTNRAGETDTRADITVRVPAENLTQVLESFKKDAIQILQENISGQDVTQEYVDLQSRLTNLKTAESQYQTFMEDTQNITEVTTIYNELIRLREEIEVIEGRIRYFDESAAFSSVTVNLYPPEAEVEIVDSVEGWSPGETVEDALDALGTTLEGLGTLVIWMVVYLLPVVLIFAVPVALAYYAFRRFRKAYQRS